MYLVLIVLAATGVTLAAAAAIAALVHAASERSQNEGLREGIKAANRIQQQSNSIPAEANPEGRRKRQCAAQR